ncbi:DMT family transporter [Patescibacteria group bacterium]
MNTAKGIKLALVTALVSGVSIFINKFAVKSITPPLVFTATKNILVGLLIIAMIIKNGKFKQIKNLSRSHLTKLGLIGIVGGSLPFYLFFTGLSQIPAINGALIHKTMIFWIALIAIPFLKERLSLLQVGAVLALFYSNTIIGGFKGFAFSTGELMIVGSTILWSIENIIAKITLKDVDSDIVTTARMAFGAVILVAASAIKHPESLSQITSLSSIQWFWLLTTASTLLMYVLSWYKALKHAPATTVASVLVGSTIVTNILSATFITHAWSAKHTTQAVIITVAVAIFIREANRSKPNQVLSKAL